MFVRKNKTIVLIILILTVVFYITGCGAKKSDTKPAGQEAVPVKVVKAVKCDILHTDDFFAVLSPKNEVTITAKAGGDITAVKKELGDRVEKGEILIELEKQAALAQLKQAEAGLAAAKANLKALEGSNLLSQLNQAEANYNRMKELFEAGAVSKQQLEAAEVQYNSVKTGYDAALAQVKQAEAAVELARTNYDNTVIESPISGWVSMVNAKVGQVAAPGSPLMRVVDIDTLTAEISIPESIINNIEVGQVVKVEIDALGGRVFKGILKSISPSADPMTHSFIAEVEVENPGRVIKGGMFAKVSLVTDSHMGAVTVPIDAVLGDVNKFVYVLDDKTAKKRDVAVGISSGGLVEVVKGLKEGEEVIVEGNNMVSDGQEVEVVSRGDNR
ncbi:MAG: HlyD family secretion protein [Thermosediminibacterales bacterium]|nr:HlyD family secretion protein [Thermosediminibacterales bacterium]MDK2836361.1 HlyD family secretion protein [Thermosediminibacterales bacterium]